MTKTVLLTGATGYIGHSLAKFIVNRKTEYLLSVVVRQNSDVSRLPRAVKQYIYDGHAETMVRIVNDVRPDVIIHLAAKTCYSPTVDEIDELLSANISMGVHLLEAMKVTNVKKLILTGTYWQHYNNEEYNPVNLYAASKQALLDLAKFYVEAYQFKLIMLELFDVYGPGDWRFKIFNLLKQAADNQTVLEMTSAEQLIDFVHIADVLNAYCVAVDRLTSDFSLSGGVLDRFSVTTGKPRQLREVVAVFEAVLMKPIRVKYGNKPYRLREMMVSWLKGKCLPNWQSKIDLENGLTCYLEKEKWTI